MINKTTIIYTVYLTLVLMSRYVLNYHSPIQLLAGFIIGIVSTITMKIYGRSLLKMLSRQDSTVNNNEDDGDRLY